MNAFSGGSRRNTLKHAHTVRHAALSKLTEVVKLHPLNEKLLLIQRILANNHPEGLRPEEVKP